MTERPKTSPDAAAELRTNPFQSIGAVSIGSISGR